LFKKNRNQGEGWLFWLAIEGEISIDQASLTGESLPVNKVVGDEVFSGSTCKQGEGEAIGLLELIN